MIDLHVHTTCSDGTVSPKDVVRLAAEQGLSAIAITDHDTVKGLSEACEAGDESGVEVVSGVEVSTHWDSGILHILGYFIDTTSSSLQEDLHTLAKGRNDRIPEIVSRLGGIGVQITEEEVMLEAGRGVPGRPHVANVLVKKGLARDRQTAFERYLRRGAPAYVEKKKLSPRKSVELITKAKGVAVAAHPYSLNLSGAHALVPVLEELMSFGLQGLEVYYPRHSVEQTREYLRIARELGLVVTGGTDFHGDNKPGIQLGKIPGHSPLPSSLLEQLRDQWKRNNQLSEPDSSNCKRPQKAVRCSK